MWLEAGGNNIARFTSTGIDDDKWHHLVIVYDNNDATNTKLYFDNSSATKTTILSQPSSLNFNGDNTVIKIHSWDPELKIYSNILLLNRSKTGWLEYAT